MEGCDDIVNLFWVLDKVQECVAEERYAYLLNERSRVPCPIQNPIDVHWSISMHIYTWLRTKQTGRGELAFMEDDLVYTYEEKFYHAKFIIKERKLWWS